MGHRSHRSEQDRLNLLSGQFLLLATFVLNLATTFGAVWTIFQLGLNGSDLQATLFSIKRLEALGEVLSFSRGVATTSVLAKDRLIFDEISNEMITFLAGDNMAGNRASISLNPDYISMQARSFGSQRAGGGEYSFRVEREVDKLNILGSVHNIRSLRPLLDSEAEAADLTIRSGEQLELSGNLGLGVHSKDITLESGDGVFMESREGGLEIRAAPGEISLPELRLHQEHLEPRFPSREQEIRQSDVLMNQPSRGYFLCICKSDGLVFKTYSTCD